jgi:phage terminase small subunit
VKKATGTYRRDRDHAAPALAGEPTIPPELDEVARRIWTETVPLLLEVGTLAKSDGGTLAAYCSTLGQALRLSQKAAKSPIDGFGRISAASIEARKLWPLVERLAGRLGLHYAGRART